MRDKDRAGERVSDTAALARLRRHRPEFLMIEVEVAYGAGKGALLLNAFQSSTGVSVEPASISITRLLDPGRRDAEHLIESVYAKKYGARITAHYPSLMSLRSSTGDTIASVGFRAASEQPLFLEQYLDHPVEQVLEDSAGRTVSRGEIVEIGNLAARSSGASLFLFVTLAALLRYRGFIYAAATTTRALKRSIESFDFQLMTLGAGDPRRLADQGASWGSYYAAQPVIVAGEIAQCFERLAYFLPPDRNPHLADLFAEDGDLEMDLRA